MVRVRDRAGVVDGDSAGVRAGTGRGLGMRRD